MGNIAHTVSAVEGSGALWAAGHIQCNNTTLTFTRISSPQFFASDISVTRIGAGRYQVTLNNFRAQNGFVIPVVTAGSSATAGGGAGATLNLMPLSTVVAAGSYNTTAGLTDQYSFVIGIATSGTFTDADCYFQALAY